MARGKVFGEQHLLSRPNPRSKSRIPGFFVFFVDLRYTAPFRQIWHVITTVRLIGRL